MRASLLLLPFYPLLTSALVKRGYAFAAQTADIATLSSSKVGWVYNWSPTPPSGLGTKVLMQWGSGGISSLASQIGNATYLLAFNEPDLTSQSNLSPATAAQLFKQYIQPIQTKNKNLKVGAPAVSAAPGGRVWLASFLTACNGCKFDFLPIHWYGEGVGNFYDYIWSMNGQFKMNLWITEYASTSTDVNVVTQFMKDSVKYLDTLTFVQGYAWFGAFRSSDPWAMLDKNGKLTALGTAYKTL